MSFLAAIWQIPEGFATLVAGLVVIIAAGIAWWSVQRQIRATQEIEAAKVRLDLYNRRFQIFVSIFDFYEALIGWEGTPEQREAQARFFRAYQELGFLFSKESGIEDILEKLHKESATRAPPSPPNRGAVHVAAAATSSTSAGSRPKMPSDDDPLFPLPGSIVLIVRVLEAPQPSSARRPDHLSFTVQ